MIVDIIKGGIRQQVTELDFERNYKPKGWKIDKNPIRKTSEILETVKKLEESTPVPSDTEVKNYLKMKKKTPKKFDDKLFKGDD